MKLSRNLARWKSGKPRRIGRPFWGILLIIAMMLSSVCPSLAQPKVLRIGVLTPGMAFDPVFLGFKEGLGRIGYKEENIEFIVEDTHGGTSDLGPRLANLLAAKPDMLYTVGTVHAIAAKQATSIIPVVFAWVGDPIQARLIASYGRSNTNATGVSTSSDALSGKRLEALLEVAPKVKRVLAIVAPKEYVAQSSFRYLQETAQKLKVQVIRREASTEEEVRQALHDMPKGSVDAIYHIPSYLGSYIHLLIEEAKQNKIPLVVHEESMVEKGALVSYGPDFRSVGVQSARLAAKILKGEKPSDIPSEMPEKLLLNLNLSTAKAIGHKIPREILERADRLVD